MGFHFPLWVMCSPVNIKFTQDLRHQFAHLHDRDILTDTTTCAISELQMHACQRYRLQRREGKAKAKEGGDTIQS